MAEHWTRRARRWAGKAAMPVAVFGLAVLLMRGAFAHSGELGPARIGFRLDELRCTDARAPPVVTRPGDLADVCPDAEPQG